MDVEPAASPEPGFPGPPGHERPAAPAQDSDEKRQGVDGKGAPTSDEPTDEPDDHKKSIRQLLNNLSRHLDDINIPEVTAGMYQLIKIAKSLKDDGQWQSVFAQHQPKIEALLNHNIQLVIQDKVATDKRMVSTVCWALGVFQYYDAPSLEALAKSCILLLHEFDPDQFSRVIWAFAAIQFTSARPLFLAAAGILVERSVEFDTSSLSTIVWSFATARVAHPGFFEAAANVLIECKEIDSVELCNIAWSYATMRITNPNLFHRIGHLAQACIVPPQPRTLFQPHTVSLLAWAFSTVRERHELLFSAIADDCISKADNAETAYPLPCFTSILCSFAAVNFEHKEFLRASSEIIRRRLVECSQQDITNICCAFNSLGHSDDELWDCIGEEIIRKLDSFAPQHLTNVLLVFSKPGYENDKLIGAVLTNSLHRLREFDTLTLLHLFRCAADLEVSDSAYNMALGDHLAQEIPKFSPLEVSHLLQTLVAVCSQMKTSSQEAKDYSKLTAKIHKALLPRIPDYLLMLKPKDFAGTISSFEKIGLLEQESAGKQIWRIAVDIVMQDLGQGGHIFSPRDLATIVQVLSDCEVSEDFFHALAAEIAQRLPELIWEPGALAALVCAWIHHSPDDEGDGLLREIVALIDSAREKHRINPLERVGIPELNLLVSAYMTAGVIIPNLFQSVARAMERVLTKSRMVSFIEHQSNVTKGLNAKDVAALISLLGSFVAAGCTDPKLFRRATEEIMRPMEVQESILIDGYCLAQCILVVATVGVATISLAQQVAKAVLDRLPNLRPKERALIIFSLAMQGRYDIEPLNTLFIDVLSKTPWEAWAKEQEDKHGRLSDELEGSGQIQAALTLSHVYLADLAYSLEVGEQILTPDVAELCWEALINFQRHKRKISKSSGQRASLRPGMWVIAEQKSNLISRVMEALITLGVPVLNTRMTREGFCLDIRIYYSKGERTCLEIACPNDFVVNVESWCARPCGFNSFKQRLLRRLGWKVRVIAWYEIETRDCAQLLEYVRTLLFQEMKLDLDADYLSSRGLVSSFEHADDDQTSFSSSQNEEEKPVKGKRKKGESARANM